MLSAAHAALVELGVLSSSDPLPPFWARMSGNLVLMTYPEDPKFYLVKIGIRTRLDREYRGLSIAHAAMPRHVPEPLGLGTHDSFQVLVARGIAHRQFVMDGETLGVFERGMDAFVATSLAHFQAAPADSTVNVQDAVFEASGIFDWPGWRRYWDDAQRLIATLPRILQHGDLAVNNMGVADDELVFFDWEDFGQVDLMGFDLAVALLSINNFDLARLHARLKGDSLEAGLVRRCCSRLDKSPDAFFMLLPAYLSLFIKVKSAGGYDQAVSARAVAALREWVRISGAE